MRKAYSVSKSTSSIVAPSDTSRASTSLRCRSSRSANS